MKKRVLKVMLLLMTVLNVKAQTSQAPSDNYLKTMNSYVPGSPEAAQIMKYVDYPVSLFTGTPQIGIPVFTVTGKGISVPVSISYHAGGGIKTDELATNIGLGWTLNAGGAITREVRGNPDEGSGVGGFIHKPYPISHYITSYINTAGTYNDFMTWVDANAGIVDLEPDIFYFSFGGKSGKFIYDDSLQVFSCITQQWNLSISFDNYWTITDDDGTKYIFASPEYTSTRIENYGSMGGNTGPGPMQITAWNLSKVINADRTDSIMLNYNYDAYSYYSGGTNIEYEALPVGTTVGLAPDRPPLLSFSNNTITGFSKLTSITGSQNSVEFLDEANNRLDLGQKALSKIVLKNASQEVVDIFKLHHSYFNRPYGIGGMGGTDLTYSLRLDSISEFGNSESNSNPLVHGFSYNPQQLPRRLCFEQDFWGYYNSNTYTQSLVPALSYTNGLYVLNFPGADRTPDTVRCKAAMLEEIRLPTGGTVRYVYEPNTIGYPIAQSNPAGQESVSQNITVFKEASQAFDAVYRDSFVVNQAENASMNFSQGGVFANILIFPKLAKTSANGYPNFNMAAGPYFRLQKYADIPNAPATGAYDETFQYDDLNSIHLPNGYYVMSAFASPLNGSSVINTTRTLGFAITYSVLSSTAFTNYSLCGSRVKSIITKDPYANITNIRNFHYHNPETDSSYGRFIGTTLSYYDDLGGGGGEIYHFLVRMGSNNIPGMGNTSSNVVYQQVTEDVTNEGITQRVEHYFTSGIPAFPRYSTSRPFVPAMDIERARGNEYMTKWKKYTSGSFTDARIQQTVFDPEPTRQSPPYSEFTQILQGIRCANSTYNETVNATGWAPQFIAPYTIFIGRLYITSDSTTTYDLNNANRSTTEWHDYTYGDHNMLPVVTRTGNSDGSVSVSKTWYAADQPEPNSNINDSLAMQMAAANRVSQPLGTKQYKDNQLLSQQYTYAHFDGNKLLTDSLRQALFNNNIETEVKVLQYDNNANPLTIAMRGGKFRKYIWNTDRNLPLATAVMPGNNFFYFSSFEYGDGTPGNAFSGSKAKPLSAGSFNMLSAFGPTDVYMWATGSAFTVNSAAPVSTGKTKGGWTLFKVHLTGGTSISITGTATIDQLVILPEGSQFQGNVYDSSNRVTAVVNDQMMTGFFEYDNFGRLKTVRDEQGNIVKASAYQYQGPE